METNRRSRHIWGCVAVLVAAMAGAYFGSASGAPDKIDGRPPAIKEGGVTAFIGGWKDPAKLIKEAQAVGDKESEAALIEMRDSGLALMLLLVFADDRAVLLRQGTVVVETPLKTYRDSGLIAVDSKSLRRQDVRVKPGLKQPVKVAVLLPRECSLAVITGITLTEAKGGE